MLRLAALIVGLFVLEVAPAYACRVAPAVPNTIIFPSVPRDVREDLLILQVTFVDVNAIAGSRPRITRARVDRVVQGALTARNVYLVSPSSGACQTELRQGQRAYIIGHLHAPDRFGATFDAYETLAVDAWRGPAR